MSFEDTDLKYISIFIWKLIEIWSSYYEYVKYIYYIYYSLI